MKVIKKILAIVLVIGTMYGYSVEAQATDDTPVERILPEKIRGSHMKGYFSSEYKGTGEDWARLEQWGFNVVRFHFDADNDYQAVDEPPEEFENGVKKEAIAYYSEAMKGLDEQLVYAKRHGIKIMLCPNRVVGRLAANDAFWKGDSKSIALWNHLAEFWGQVAQKYKYEDSIIMYGLLNEPQFANNGVASWTIVPNTDFHSTTEMEYKTGRKSMMYDLEYPDWKDVASQQIPSVDENETYTLKGYIKPGSDASGKINLRASHYDNAGNPITFDNTNNVDVEDQSWQEVSTVFTPPDGTTNIIAGPYFRNASGRAYFDNIILHKGDSINGNVADNPGFEDLGTWWYKNGYAWRTDEDAFDGEWSGKISSTVDGYAEISYYEGNIDGETEYTLSAMLKATETEGLDSDVVSHQIAVKCFNDSGYTGTVYRSPLKEDIHDWEYTSVTFTTPVSDCNTLQVSMRLYNKGTAFFDKVELYKGGANLLANEGFDEDELWDDILYPKLKSAVRAVDGKVYIAKQPLMTRSMFSCTPDKDKDGPDPEAIDDTVIYTTHFYEPFDFTHQTLSTEYPNTANDWNKDMLSRRLEHYREWLEFYGIPSDKFIVGEFAAKRAQPKVCSTGTGQWAADAVGLFETEHWHWLHLAYSGDAWNGWNDTYATDESDWPSKRAFGGQVGPQLAALLAVTGKEHQTNANGGFEYLDDNDQPLYFSYTDCSTGCASSTDSNSGEYSLNIHRDSDGQSSVHQWLDVVPGRTMAIHVSMKVANFDIESGNGARISVEQYDGDQKISPVTWEASRWETDTPFVTRGNQFALDANARKVKISLTLDGKGDAYFDDLEVIDKSERTEPDTDSDGVADWLDNCICSFNPDQADDDGDNVGNACEVEDPDFEISFEYPEDWGGDCGYIMITNISDESLPYPYGVHFVLPSDLPIYPYCGGYTGDVIRDGDNVTVIFPEWFADVQPGESATDGFCFCVDGPVRPEALTLYEP